MKSAPLDTQLTNLSSSVIILDMIQSIEFKNFRNLSGKYVLRTNVNFFIGKNSSGKTNLLDGVRLAFSVLTGDFFKVSKTDFLDCDDSNPISIKVELDVSSIPSFNYIEHDGTTKCGFEVIVRKRQSGRYFKELRLLNGAKINYEIVGEDPSIPKIQAIPLIRAEDIYTDALPFSLADFIESEEKYQEIKKESKKKIKAEMSQKVNDFKVISKKFNKNLDIELSDPRLLYERIFIVDEKGGEHRSKIGSGYKSIANILLNLTSEGQGIILIDEIENHLHPALTRMLIRELRKHENITVIATTHSPVVVNDAKLTELIDISGVRLDGLDERLLKRLEIFLHPGRGELIFGDNIVLVEGYTEELIISSYAIAHEENWTVVNVSGVMFEPYIELGSLLGKRVIVISDDDRIKSQDGISTARFKRLETLCKSKSIKLVDVENTLESDLCKNGYLECVQGYLERVEESEYYVAKDRRKTLIAEQLISNGINLSNWHVIQDIKNEFRNN